MHVISQMRGKSGCRNMTAFGIDSVDFLRANMSHESTENVSNFFSVAFCRRISACILILILKNCAFVVFV